MPAMPNPYAPPRANVADIAPVTSEAEAVRREHIKHEASIMSVGMLYYIGGTLMLFGGLALILPYLNRSADNGLLGALGFGYLILGAVSIFVGRGVRTLRRWARTTCIVLSSIGLLGFPIGTLINAYVLYLMLAKRGKRIFESDYPGIIAMTPDVKYRTSLIVWILLGLLLLVVALAIIGVAVRRG